MATGTDTVTPGKVVKLDWHAGELARQIQKTLGERKMREADVALVITAVMKYRDDYYRGTQGLENLLALAYESSLTLNDLNYGVFATSRFLRVPDTSRLPIEGYFRHLATVVLIAEVWTRLAYDGVYVNLPHSAELMQVWAERRAAKSAG